MFFFLVSLKFYKIFLLTINNLVNSLLLLVLIISYHYVHTAMNNYFPICRNM